MAVEDDACRKKMDQGCKCKHKDQVQLGAVMDWQNSMMQNDDKDDKKEENWQWDESQFKWIVGGDDIESEKSWSGEDTRVDMNNVNYLGSEFTSLNEVREYSKHIAVINIPIYGRIQFVKHRPGYIHLSIIVLYWIYGNWATFRYLLIPHGHEEHMSPTFMWVHCFFSLMTIISLFRATTLNPGRVPIRGQKQRPPKPNSGQGEMDYCHTCLQYRPWKSHHCRICGQCVRNMDHHCPWINNCVGEDNHWAFMQLSVYACLMSAWVFFMLCLHRWWWPEIEQTELYEGTFAWNHKYGLMVLQTIMSLLMGTLMATLAITNHVGIVLGMTTIDWRKLEEEIRKVGHFTFDMFPRRQHGCMTQYRKFCGPGTALCWFFPCRRKVPVSQASYV